MLDPLLENVSIIIPVGRNETAQNVLLSDLDGCAAEIIVSEGESRHESLNAGAAKATHEFLWFLHADSRVSAENVEVLARCIKREPQALHYFFLTYGYGRASINAWGANIRSSLFGLPYGDQGFCVSKAVFDQIGGYPDAPYGEDLLFIRKAKKAGVKLFFMPSKLRSSSRSYREKGWLKLTLIRQIQFLKLMMSRL